MSTETPVTFVNRNGCRLFGKQMAERGHDGAEKRIRKAGSAVSEARSGWMDGRLPTIPGVLPVVGHDEALVGEPRSRRTSSR